MFCWNCLKNTWSPNTTRKIQGNWKKIGKDSGIEASRYQN